ncbi:MAG: flagellar motor protein MotB [Bacillota bacterium]|nr:flagellar motor protein MotB [Bacillota bacterium]
MRKKKQHQEEHVDEKWLLPYSDMLTLLLALFIVMFAMSQIDKEKWKQLSEQFNIVFSGGTGMMPDNGSKTVSNNDSNADYKKKVITEQDKMNELKNSLEQEIKGSGYQDKIKVDLNGEGLEVSIQDTVLFNSGDAEILKNSAPVLVQISGILKNLSNQIRVAGYTDNVPISNGKFHSNWDLSYMRAANVMNFMVQTGQLSPEKFSVQAYGQYNAKYDNSTEEGRTKNRRVVINIVREYPLADKKVN